MSLLATASEGGGISRLTLSAYRPLLSRLDVTPWAVLYASLVGVFVGGGAWSTVAQYAIPVCIALHCLCGLFEVWSMRWRHWVQCHEVNVRLDASVWSPK
jgi:hypothetical protein